MDEAHDRARGGHPQELAHDAAVDRATGQVVGDKSIGVGARGFAALLIWARGLAGERVWALEDSAMSLARWSGS